MQTSSFILPGLQEDFSIESKREKENTGNILKSSKTSDAFKGEEGEFLSVLLGIADGEILPWPQGPNLLSLTNRWDVLQGFVVQKGEGGVGKSPMHANQGIVFAEETPWWAGLTENGNLGKSHLLSETDPFFQETGATIKNLMADLTDEETAPILRVDPQNSESSTSDRGFSERYLVDKGGVRGESDKGEIAPLSSSNQAYEKISEMSLQTKEAKPFQDALKTDVLTQLIEKAVLNLKNGQAAIRISLKPEILGHLRMQISTENKRLVAKILTDVPLVKEILESNISQLKTGLQDHGLEIEKFDVFVAHDSDQNAGQNESPDFTGIEETDEGGATGVSTEEDEGLYQLAEKGAGTSVINVFV